PCATLASPAAVGPVKGQSAVGHMEASTGVIDSSKTIPTSAAGTTVAVCDHAGASGTTCPASTAAARVLAKCAIDCDRGPKVVQCAACAHPTRSTLITIGRYVHPRVTVVASPTRPTTCAIVLERTAFQPQCAKITDSPAVSVAPPSRIDRR